MPLFYCPELIISHYRTAVQKDKTKSNMNRDLVILLFTHKYVRIFIYINSTINIGIQF